MRSCSSTTKKGKPCSIFVEEWRTVDKCHVHDPNGVFRQQLKESKPTKTKKTKITTIKTCKHKWYMRDPGIVCIDCGDIWQSENTNT
jgi:hypothetical protein